MPTTEITAKITTGEFKGKSAVAKVDIPDNDKEFVDKYTLPVVVSNARGQIRVAIQDVIRAGIKAKKSPADIQKDVAAYTPGLRKKGKSKAEKLAEKFEGLSPEEQKALLARFTK